MINSTQFQQLKGGGFVSIQLENGPQLSGFAAQDLEIPRLLRLDGMIENGEGSLSQFALRLEQAEIEAAQWLAEPPVFASGTGETYTMNAAFWSNMD